MLVCIDLKIGIKDLCGYFRLLPTRLLTAEKDWHIRCSTLLYHVEKKIGNFSTEMFLDENSEEKEQRKIISSVSIHVYDCFLE